MMDSVELFCLSQNLHTGKTLELREMKQLAGYRNISMPCVMRVTLYQNEPVLENIILCYPLLHDFHM